MNELRVCGSDSLAIMASPPTASWRNCSGEVEVVGGGATDVVGGGAAMVVDASGSEVHEATMTMSALMIATSDEFLRDRRRFTHERRQ